MTKLVRCKLLQFKRSDHTLVSEEIVGFPENLKDTDDVRKYFLKIQDELLPHMQVFIPMEQFDKYEPFMIFC